MENRLILFVAIAPLYCSQVSALRVQQTRLAILSKM